MRMVSENYTITIAVIGRLLTINFLKFLEKIFAVT